MVCGEWVTSMANYLYNGIELPASPYWYPETYRHSVLVSWSPDGGVPYRLYHCVSRPYLNSNNELVLSEYIGGTSPVNQYSSVAYYNYYSAEAGGPNWDSSPQVSGFKEIKISGTLAIWTNTDIYTEDGSLYLAASDPVPVPQLNPAALMQGFATMLSLRRNRT